MGKNVASFNPADHTEGGYLDDKDCTIVKSRVVSFDFNGNTDPMCCWMVQFHPDGAEDGEDDDRIEYLRIGPLDKFTPNKDETEAVAVNNARINKKSKASLFAKSLVEAGFDADKLGSGKVDVIDGLRVHVNVETLPSFKNKDGEEVKGGQLPKITAILGEDGGASQAAPKTSSKASKKSKKTEKAEKAEKVSGGSDDAVSKKAEGAVLTELAQRGGSASKVGLPNVILVALAQDKDRNAAIALVHSEDWLGDDDRPWSYEGGELSLG